MLDHQRRFFELALRREVLCFGEFTLKSGRISPYFFNAGRFDSGGALAALAECYVDALLADGLEFDMLFGPAYKGIPLATAVGMALAARGRDLPIAFNRKEAKAHGEGGELIGAPLCGRVLVVDDVITAGTAVRESIALIEAAGARACGVLVALDRQEICPDGRSAVAGVVAAHGLRVISVARLNELLTYTAGQPELAQHHARLSAYRRQFGAATAAGDET